MSVLLGNNTSALGNVAYPVLNIRPQASHASLSYSDIIQFETSGFSICQDVTLVHVNDVFAQRYLVERAFKIQVSDAEAFFNQIYPDAIEAARQIFGPDCALEFRNADESERPIIGEVLIKFKSNLAENDVEAFEEFAIAWWSLVDPETHYIVPRLA